MKLSAYPHLSHCLALLGTDMGAILAEDVEIPEKWQDRVVQAEFELSQLTPTQVETFTMGEEREQAVEAEKAPAADAVLRDAFDGDLSEVFYNPIDNALDYHKVTEQETRLKANLLTKQGA
jgi:hypothetical protein